MAWLSGWTYRRKITISGSSGAGTNYQVLLKIGESLGATGCHFHLDGLSANFPSERNQGGDLRFTADDGVTLLGFWVENVQGSSPNRVANVWVKVTADLGTSKDIYCYFGNPSATNASSGADTFIFFDDFESYADGSDINNQGGWVTKRVGGLGEAKVRLVNGRKHLHLSSTDQGTAIVHALSTSNSGCALRLYEYADDWDEALKIAFGDGTISSSGDFYNGYEVVWWGWGGGTSKIRQWVNGNVTDLATLSDSDTNNTYHTLEFTWLGSALKAFRDEAQKLSATDSTYSSQTYLQLGEWAGSSRYIDWIILRKYVSPEPAFSSAGAIEISGWPRGWRYRCRITIAGSSGAGTGYQVLLKVGESQGATGCDFHLGGLSAKFPSQKNDGGDLRFATSDGTAFVNFWVEKVEGTSPNRVAYVWVKVSADLGTNQDILIYYGNPNATNASNGDNTFLFFDDFEGTSLNTNKWSTEWLYGASYSISNSVITITSAGTRPYIHSLQNFNAPFAIEALVQKINSDIEFCWFVTGPFKGSADNAPTTAYQLVDAVWLSPESVAFYKSSDKNWSLLVTAPQSIAAGWHKMRVFQKTNGLEGDIDAVKTISSTDTSYQSGNICLSQRELNGDQSAFDYIFVRKYVSPEPAFSSASGIQVLPSSRRLLLMPI